MHIGLAISLFLSGGHIFQFLVLLYLYRFLCFMCVGIPTYMGHFVSFTQHISHSQRLTPIHFEDHKYLRHISLQNTDKKVNFFENNLCVWKSPDMCGNYTTCVVFTTHLKHVDIVWENPPQASGPYCAGAVGVASMDMQVFDISLMGISQPRCSTISTEFRRGSKTRNTQI